MNILMVGDVVGKAGMDIIKKRLWKLRETLAVDMVVCNGENASTGNGLMPEDAAALISAGVDIITSGNHIWNRKEIYPMLEECASLIRPANYPSSCPGTGTAVFKGPKADVLVINLCGRVYMEGTACPFEAAEKILEKYPEPIIKLLDFHAEATSEKKAIGYYLAGRVTAVAGTHTHVPTSDCTVLSEGTAYITDLGMTGAVDSILGVEKEIIIKKFLTSMPQRFIQAEGPAELQAMLVEADEKTGRALSARQIAIS